MDYIYGFIDIPRGRNNIGKIKKRAYIFFWILLCYIYTYVPTGLQMCEFVEGNYGYIIYEFGLPPDEMFGGKCLVFPRYFENLRGNFHYL